MSQVCIFFAPGLEEIEGLTVVDLMRRAGISIQVVSVADTLDITGAHNTISPQTHCCRIRIFPILKCSFFRAARREPVTLKPAAR